MTDRAFQLCIAAAWLLFAAIVFITDGDGSVAGWAGIVLSGVWAKS